MALSTVPGRWRRMPIRRDRPPLRSVAGGTAHYELKVVWILLCMTDNTVQAGLASGRPTPDEVSHEAFAPFGDVTTGTNQFSQGDPSQGGVIHGDGTLDASEVLCMALFATLDITMKRRWLSLE